MMIFWVAFLAFSPFMIVLYMNRDSKILPWIGNIASIIGAFVVGAQIFIIGYSLFIMGSVSWLITAWLKRDKALMVLNGFFLLANFWGLYNAI